MTLLAPVSNGFLEEDTGAPGLYRDESGVYVLRTSQGGSLDPVGTGGGVTAPVNIATTDPAIIPLTVTGPDAALDNEFVVETSFGIVLGIYGDSTAGVTNYNNMVFYGFIEVNAFNATQAILTIRDSNAAPVFQVQADGSVHIKTGGSIIADL